MSDNNLLFLNLELSEDDMEEPVFDLQVIISLHLGAFSVVSC